MNAEKKFKKIMTEHGKEKCPNCGKEIDMGDLAWNNGQTESGTEYTLGEIQCSACDTEIASGGSWWTAGTFEDFVDHVLEDVLEGR